MLFDFDKYSNNIAVITEGGISYKYSDLKSIISYNSKIMEPSTLAFCLCNNEFGSLIAYLSCLEHGVVPVMLDASKDLESIIKLLDVYKPNYVWAPDSRADEFGFDCVSSNYGYSLLSAYNVNYNLHPDLALLLTTSGSTGSPKLVRLTYKNIISNAESIAEYLDITEKERPVTSLPMYYSFGISVINSHLLKGATILLTDKSIAQKEFWTFVKEQKATSLSGVPYTFEMLKRLRIFRMDLPYLQTFTQAGGKLNADLAKEYIENAAACGNRFIVMYGQTEATARMSYLPWNKALEKYSSIGIAIPGGRFSIEDAQHNEITEPNVDGELVYRGPNVSMGYAECIEDLAKGDENCGVLHTGDVARRDKDGFYYITGRMKRFVKVFGNRVNLDATEQILKSAGFECSVVGVDDKITIFVVRDGLEQSIKDLLLQKTGLNTRAFSVKQIEMIPKSTSGKVLYSELMKLI